MKQGLLFVLCLIFGAVGFAAAQTKPVTNADLEVYRQDRLKAEREYRENYARLGLPSPEELDARREKSRVEMEELSAKLRAERLERERIQAERNASAALAGGYYQSGQPGYQQQYDGSYGDYGYGYGSYYSPGTIYGRRRYLATPYQSGYFAGGQFWPTPIRPVRTGPAWVGPRASPRPGPRPVPHAGPRR
jgi:hypothetical protein